MTERKRPTRGPGGMHDDYTEEHEAYALIGASRVSGGANLFNSDFVSHNYMTVTIRRAVLSRGLSSDYVHGREELIEVALTEAQWATFVATPNVGQGVPCTLQWLNGVGHVPRIEFDQNRRTQFNTEVQQDLSESIAFMEAALAQAKTKAQRQPIEMAIQRLKSGLPFIAKRFDEHAEQTVEKMKIDVNAWMTSAVTRAGLQALGAVPPLELAEPNADE